MSFFQKLMMWLGIIVTGFIALAVSLVSFSFYTTSGMVDTIQGQLASLREGDIVTAYSYTAQDFQKVTSLDEFKKFLDQYPSLRINQSAYFTEREFNNNNLGVVKGNLNAKDGTSLSVEYRLIKENDKWKILGIQVIPPDAGIKVVQQTNTVTTSEAQKPVAGTAGTVEPPKPETTAANVQPPTPSTPPTQEQAPTPAPTPNAEPPKVANEMLPNTFEDPENNYSIKYPADWSYEKENNGTMVFGGNKGTPAYFSTVSIKVIPTKQNGGRYKTIEKLMENFKRHIEASANNVNFISDDPIELPASSLHEKMLGRVYVASYSFQGQTYKQMQFFFIGDDGDSFYTFAYTSTLERYQIDYPTAQAMFSTWMISNAAN